MFFSEHNEHNRLSLVLQSRSSLLHNPHVQPEAFRVLPSLARTKPRDSKATPHLAAEVAHAALYKEFTADIGVHERYPQTISTVFEVWHKV
jgi:hypothetical protein